MTIGERMRSIRRERNLTQAKVAHALGITPGALSKIERNINGMSKKTLQRLCRYYNLPLEILQNPDMIISSERPICDDESVMHGQSHSFSNLININSNPASINKSLLTAELMIQAQTLFSMPNFQNDDLFDLIHGLKILYAQQCGRHSDVSELNDHPPVPQSEPVESTETAVVPPAQEEE